VEDITFSANLPANRDIRTDRPGRSFGPRAAHLRKNLPKSALSKVTAELAQDLVKTPHSELPRKLKDVLKG
jgi:hypothetical protein